MKRMILPALLVLLLAVGCQAPTSSGDSAAPAPAKTVDIVSFNDFHGTLAEDVKNPGIAKMATMVAWMKKLNPNTVVVSAGDNYQGSALSAITKGGVVNEFFSYIGLTASAVGNHEFDWGSTNFGPWSKAGKFPFLAANIVDKKTGKVPAWAQEWTIVQVGGHKIALVGFATVETLTKTKAEYIADYDFKKPADIAPDVLARLKAQEKPEVIIALTHLPSGIFGKPASETASDSPEQEMANLALVPGINAIITGHSHFTVAGLNNGVPVVQGSYNGRAFGKLAIEFKSDGTFAITPSTVTCSSMAFLAPDPAVKKIIADNETLYGAGLKDKVATLAADLPRGTSNVGPMGKWVCDVLRSKYKVDVYFQNGGGLRKDFLKGDLLVQDFWDLMPFDNYTVTFKVSGAVLKAIVSNGIDPVGMGAGQFSGLRVTYDAAKVGVDRIKTLVLDQGTADTADDVAVTDTGLYAVGTNDFQFGGGDKYTMMKPNATNVVETFQPIRDDLIAAAKAAGTLPVPSVAGICEKVTTP